MVFFDLFLYLCPPPLGGVTNDTSRRQDGLAPRSEAAHALSDPRRRNFGNLMATVDNVGPLTRSTRQTLHTVTALYIRRCARAPWELGRINLNGRYLFANGRSCTALAQE